MSGAFGGRKLRTIVGLAKADPRFVSGCVCFCYPAGRYVRPELGDVYKRSPVGELTEEELDSRWLSSEWWIESGDLCVCRGK